MISSHAKLLVIIVNYNGINDTRELLESLNKQESVVDVIIIDNNSNNREGEVLKKENPNIEVVINEKNLGFAGANNIGFEYAKIHNKEYILLLNNDTVVDKNMIGELLEKANTSTVVVPCMYHYYKNDIWYGGGIINYYTGNVEHKKWKDKRFCDFATGCCFLAHIDIINKIGNLDESYFMYCEDVEYSLRMKLNDVKILYNPKAFLYHKVGRSSGGKKSAICTYYVIRNRIKYIKLYKHEFSRIALGLTVLTRLLKLLIMFFSRNIKWKAYKKGIIDGLKGIDGPVDISKIK